MLQKVNEFIFTKFCEDRRCYYPCSTGKNLGHREIIGLTEKDAATLEEIE